VSLTKVGKALQFAQESGLKVTRKIMADALGRAQLGGAAEFNGKVWLNAFTSDVIAHELAHSFDTPMVDGAGNIIRNWKKVFGEDRRVIQRLSSAINDRDIHEGITGKKLRVGQKTVFQQELSAVTDYTGLGGSPTYKARAVERFAEFVNLYIHDPRQARTLAPEFTRHFETGILPNNKIKGLIENLSKFFQKIDGLPNVYTPLREMDDQNYLELAIRTAFPEGREHLGVIFGEKARKGYEIVKYHKDGKVQALEVTRDIARAIQGLTPGSSSLLVRTMQMAAMPLKLGATGMNAAFQPVNLLFADLPRAAFVSRYGIRNMKDLFKFPADYLYSFFTAVKGNFGHPNDLYKQLLDGGALNSTIQRELTPGVFDPTSFQKSFGKKYVLEALPRLANAIEETGKTVGFKRALRLDEIAKMGPDQADEAIKRIVTEVRNFSGSPDFLRRGQAAAGSNIANLNLLFMFFNARIQGAASDLARLTGKAEGGGRAAAMAWKRMSAAVGAPALTLAVYNHLPWNREDYDKIPLWERENYFMIPRFDRWGRAQYFTNDQGERIRDYWRIPKREITGLYGNMIEAGVKFAIDRNLETIAWFAGEFLENISPVTIIGETFGDRGQSVISSLNPILKVPVELALGKDTFRKRDIVPQTIAGVSSRDLPPEEKYTKHTPEVFKQIGKVTGPLLGASPLHAEHAVRGATAGLVTQFLPRRAPGREGVSTWPVVGHVAARFQRSAGVAPTERTERIREALVEQGGAKIKVNREAERVWEGMRTLPPEEQYRRWEEVHDESPETAERILRVAAQEAKGLGWEERQLGQLQVKNGERAKFIASELERLSPQEKVDWIGELRDSGLLSEEVWGQVLERLR
jgi:hypothetical protein